MDDGAIVDLVDATDRRLVGGKAHALGRLVRSGFAVPAGFVLTTKTFRAMGPELESLLLQRFDQLDTDAVAVRSSAVAEDGSQAAWAGQLETFLNTTRETLVRSIEDCWRSTDSARAQAYAAHHAKQSGAVGVIVQEMIQSDVSGVAFSVHPITQNSGQIVIEAGLGLGEAIVSGQITPDMYISGKRTAHLIEKHVAHQSKQLVRTRAGLTRWQATHEAGRRQKLPDVHIRELSVLVYKLEMYFGYPVDVEWALRDSNLYILQSRPITTLAKNSIIDAAGRTIAYG